MPFRRRGFVGGLVAIVIGGFALSAGPVLGAQPNNGQPNGHYEHRGQNGDSDVNVCSDAVPVGQARCFAHVRTDKPAKQAMPVPAGRSGKAATLGNSGAYDPSYLQSAYNTPSATAGAGQTVAIVDAYDDPNAAADLNYYRSFFGLPSCTTANGCFKKVDEYGRASSHPAGDPGWSQEISLDLDMVSAICPLCKITLVEAYSTYLTDLGTAVNTAVNLGANVVSNSYGGSEYGSEVSDGASYYRHPGVAVVASSGDNGYGVEFPAASNDVIAVGGTSLIQNTNTGTRNGTETAWSGAGSGCSAFESKPSWQHDTGCSLRTVADVSAVADPSTGVWVYDTYSSPGFQVFGGTSVASPIVGSVYALAANPASSDTLASYPYAHPSAVNDVTSGSNGTCAPVYLCNAVSGYDGPTGLGTPNSTPAFSAGSVSPAPPSAPLGLSATPGNAKVTLSWLPPSSTGGSSLTYTVYRGTSAGTESTTVAAGLTSTGYVDSTVSNGTTYYFIVTAVNSTGPSPASNETSATPATVPGAPSLTATTSATKGVTLQWSAPVSNGGSAITGYEVYRSTSSGREGAYVAVTCTASTCTYNDSNTRRGTTYYYQVAGINAAGTGSRSGQAKAKAR